MDPKGRENHRGGQGEDLTSQDGIALKVYPRSPEQTQGGKDWRDGSQERPRSQEKNTPRGDGKADLFRKRHALRYFIYFVALPALIGHGVWGFFARWLGWVGAVLGGLTLLVGISPLQYMAGFTGPILILVMGLGFAFGDRDDLS